MILLGFAFSFLLLCLANLQAALIYWHSCGINLYNTPKFCLICITQSWGGALTRAVCMALTWPQIQMHDSLYSPDDTITQYFSLENPLTIYHMRSVFIFAAECLTLSFVLHNQAGIFLVEYSVREAKGNNPSVHPTLTLALTIITAESSHLFLPESREPERH